MNEQALRRKYHLPPDRYRIGPGSQVAEIPPMCPRGHRYRPGHVIVGWLPCHCEGSSNGGHRTHHCLDCNIEVHTPECVSIDRTTAEHGLRF